MRFDVLTLFPELCETFLHASIIGRAVAAGKIEAYAHNIRDYTLNRQKQTDDAPYGGRQGMVLNAQPVYDCFMAVCEQTPVRPRLIYMSPAGAPLTQTRVTQLAQYPCLAVLCGHYEGVDERVLDEIVDEQISVGDFVVTGGELPALMLVDAVARMCDGVLSTPQGYEDESHFSGLLEYPQYTRPEVWRDRTVPEVLRSGHHANIQKWKSEQSVLRTRLRRPDMYADYVKKQKK